ncbi:MAG: ATP-dependent DNA helicase UvrD2 [Varibaculum sp.]|nr:ATP-dependent DNA helicase UvrD2 [Varibaculum sp.]
MESADELLQHLDPQQREVATTLTGPICVRAGAGTGKTRAITYRIAYAAVSGQWNPREVLALTFTKKAAGELRSRLAVLGVEGVSARTFHSQALRQLRYFWPYAVGGDTPTVQEHKATLVAAACARMNLIPNRERIRDISAEIEWVAVSMVPPEEYPQRVRQLGRPTPAAMPAEQFVKVMEAYQDAKSERGVIDFEDVLVLMLGIMQDRPDIAARINGSYRHFIVDEYQDVSPLQQELLEAWMGRSRSLCVVGDAAQTIYSFTGATSRFLTGFKEHYPDAKVITLNRDYRSTPQIVQLANGVMASQPGAVRLIAQQPDGVKVQYRKYDSDVEEAADVATQIKSLIDAGTSPNDLALLYRVNSQSALLERELSDRHIPFTTRGERRFFQRTEILQAISSLRSRSMVNPDEPLAAVLIDVVSALGWTSQPPEVRGASRERWENLQALLELGQSVPAATLSEFVAELEQRRGEDYEPTLAAVTLGTIHSAKGLEWQRVFVIGCHDGLIPISQARSEAELAEERRLLYVAITRAQTDLQLSFAASRGGSGSGGRKLSRFLSDFWPIFAPTRASSQRLSRRKQTRQRIQELDDESAELFERLRQWRMERAAVADAPAYTVFSDATLLEIAKVRPRSAIQLLRVRGVGQTKLDAFGAEIIRLVEGR